MNGYFIAAGAILTYTFFLHALVGSGKFGTLKPSAKEDPKYPVWLMGAGGVQMISVDLLSAAVLSLLIGFGLLPEDSPFSLFLLLCGGYTLSWLGTLIFHRAKASLYNTLPQWALFLIVTILLALGNLL